MSLSTSIEKAIQDNLQEFSKNEDFVKLQTFYEEMKSSGIAKKQEYTLPPMDTIGRRLYQAAISGTP